ncbi:MAG: hypothetical protein R3B51_02515 [Thermodesulfobacteriota bacterium]
MMDRLSFGFTKLFTSVSLKFIEKIVGIDVLHDMWEFFSGFEGVGEGMKARARKTDELLKSPEASFVIVTSLREDSMANAATWRGELRAGGYDVGGVVVNRVLFPRKGGRQVSSPRAFRDVRSWRKSSNSITGFTRRSPTPSMTRSTV